MILIRITILIVICFCSSLSANAIKIGLYTNCGDTIYFGVSKSGAIADAQTGNYILLLNAMKPYALKQRGGNLLISFDGKEYWIKNQKIIIKSTQEKGLVYTKKKWYRGELVVLNADNGLTVINEIDLESYVKGVVPAEMPPAWNLEAHKAQAIAARSYAVSNAGKRGKYGYDLKDTDEDQVYKGLSAETLQTNHAVDTTKGQVLVYNDKVIRAYYHASAGGSTLSAKDVWGMDLPYTVPVRSFDENLPCRGHRVGMSQNGANILAKEGYNAYQILGYFYRNVMLRTLD